MKKATGILIICLSLFLTACHKDSAATYSTDNDATEESGTVQADVPEKEQAQEWIYVPEIVTIEDEKINFEHIQLVGETVCYITRNGEAENEDQSICRYSLAEEALSVAVIQWPMEERNRDVGSYMFNPDNSVWLIANVYSEDYSQMKRFLCKFDSEGKNVISQEVTDQLGRGVSIGGMAVDSQGRIYVYTNEYSDEAGIWLFAADGSYHGAITFALWENVQVKGTANGEDGGFYVCISKGESPDHCMLMEMDFEGKELTTLTEDFPVVNGLCQGPQAGLLLYDDTCVYGYNLAAQENRPGEAAEELFVWMDSDINGYFVRNLRLTEDGRYFCVVVDWVNDDTNIVLLDRKRAEEVPRRRDMVLATVNGGSSLNALAVKFNRRQEQFRLTVKNYDSLTDLYNAILARQAIDIIDLCEVDVESLSAQGVFADLGPYVDRSEAFGRSDFLDGILDVYTFDGILAGIPETFWLRTAAGDRTLAGNAAGLSLEELLAIAGRHPEALPFGGVTREEMMQYIMLFNQDVFIDWETGQCRFDSEDFRDVLEFVKGFPEEPEEEQEVSLPTKIQNGQVLFAIADLKVLDAFQLYQGMFGENAAFVGFPTGDGKGGTLIFPENAFGIAATSENKDGAWEFIEGILSKDTEEYLDGYSQLYYPALRKNLEAQAERQMKNGSEIPDNHFPMRIFDDGWVFQYHCLTWDEVDAILDLVKEATPAFAVEEDKVIQIINEEAPGYYRGQRGAEDVAGIIQNRVQLYVNENR